MLGDDNPEVAAELITQSLRLVQACCFFVCCSRSSRNHIEAALADAGRTVDEEIVWDKVEPAQRLARFARRTEYILYSGPNAGEPNADDDLWSEAVTPEDWRWHETPKPPALIARAIRAAEAESGSVYDPFAGAGPTLIACEQTGATALLVEKDPENIARILRRWRESGAAPTGEAVAPFLPEAAA